MAAHSTILPQKNSLPAHSTKETIPNYTSPTDPMKLLSEMISELSELQGKLLDIKQALIERELQKLSSYSSATLAEDIPIPF